MPGLPAFAELTCSLQLRFADVNAAGHVANTAVPVLFDEARVRTLGYPTAPGGPVTSGLLERAGQDVTILVGQVTTEYLREIRFAGQDVRVQAWVSGLGGARFVLSAVLLDGGEVAATSECVVVLVSTATSRPVPLPADFREHLLTLSGPAVPLRPRLTTLA